MTPEQKKSLDNTKRHVAELRQSIEALESDRFEIRDTRPGVDVGKFKSDWLESQKRVLAGLEKFIEDAEAGRI